MWELDSEEAECQRIDTFELWCWRRLLRVPWTTRRSNQSILKEINPGYSSEGLMLKLKLQYFGHLMRRTGSLEKTSMLEKIEGRRRREWMTEDEMVGWTWWTWWTWVCINSRSWWWTGKPGMLQSMGPQRIRHDWTNELNWDKKKVGLALSDRLLMTLTSIYECIYMYKYHISPFVSWYTKINTDLLKLTLKLVIDYLNSCQMWYWFVNNSHMVKNNPF